MRLCAVGLRQSMRTTTVCMPAARDARASKGRYEPRCLISGRPSTHTSASQFAEAKLRAYVPAEGAASAAQAAAAASRALLGNGVTVHARYPFNSRGRRSERRFECRLTRAGAGEQLAQQLLGAGLRQGLVEVAALR